MSALSKIRDLIIVIAVYLYFTSWVYIHFYYEQFGISPRDLNIDYSAYLVYSYNVLTSKDFLKWFIAAILLTVAVKILLLFLDHLKKRRKFSAPSKVPEYPNFIAVLIQEGKEKYQVLPIIVIMVAVFPLLFTVARDVALKQYEQDRVNAANLKTIQFLFRANVDFLSPVAKLDTIKLTTQLSDNELNLIRNDTSQYLRLLGESADNYFVLLQLPYNQKMQVLPQGWVYSVSKKDVLLSKIILRSH